MSWKAENAWHNTIFKPDSLPRPVEVCRARSCQRQQNRPLLGQVPIYASSLRFWETLKKWEMYPDI